MKKTLKTVILLTAVAICLALAVFPSSAEPAYNDITVSSGKLEDLQAVLDDLPDGGSAGDVRINITQTLHSSKEEVDISVPNDKGITSLTLSHEGDTIVPIYSAGTSLNFFANGVPLVIDKGVYFGNLPTVYASVDVRVFGGSKNADITGDTSITVNEGGAVTGSIYGGGYNGGVDGNTNITVYGAYGSINGGGYVSPETDDPQSHSADVTGRAVILVDSGFVPTYEGAYKTHIYLNGSVTGGGAVSAPGWSSTPALPADCLLSAQVMGGVEMTVNCQVSSAVINGGGWVTATRKCEEGAAINADVTGDVNITIGGRFKQAADYYTDRWTCAVMGGGHIGQGTGGAAVSAQVYGDVTITAVENDQATDLSVDSGIGTIIGGGYVLGGAAGQDASVNGDVTITTSRRAPLIQVGSPEGRLGVIGGGYASTGAANVTGDVRIRICKAPGQADGYINAKNINGGGVAGQKGVAQIGGNINIEVDEGISFEGGNMKGTYDSEKSGITGGGWDGGWGGNADVAGSINITVGKDASFGVVSSDCRITGGGRIDRTYQNARVDEDDGTVLSPEPSAKTGDITITLNGTKKALPEMFFTSLEGRAPSASATVTLKNSDVEWMYDKDVTNGVDGNQSVTVRALGRCRIDYAYFEGWDYPKTYAFEVGDGTVPTELEIGDYYIYAYYGYDIAFVNLNVRVFNNAVMKKESGMML